MFTYVTIIEIVAFAITIVHVNTKAVAFCGCTGTAL